MSKCIHNCSVLSVYYARIDLNLFLSQNITWFFYTLHDLIFTKIINAVSLTLKIKDLKGYNFACASSAI